LLLSALTADASAVDVLILQGMSVQPFEEALKGFKSTCRGESRTVVLSDAENFDLSKSVREERPKVIVAIGSEALQKARSIHNIPVIYLMVLHPEKIVDGGRNFFGVEMHLPPGRYFSLMEKILHSNLKIGIIFDPEKTGPLVKRIEIAAKSKGIEIVAKEVHAPQEVPQLLSGMKGTFNVFWMLPDSTVVTSETVKFLRLFSQQNRLPVVAFSGKYLDSGALVSLDIDESDMGKQGGEMANRILEGNSSSDLSTTDARKALFRLNKSIAENLGIDLNSLEAPGITN
jgi:putative ABC transport system substrate-binding protein